MSAASPTRATAFQPEEDRLGRAFDRTLFRRLLRYGLPYRGRMAWALALTLFTTVLALLGPFVVKWAIDHPLAAAIAGSRTTAGPDARARDLFTAVGAYVAVIVATLLLRFYQGNAMSIVGQRVMHDLRVQVFGHIQRMGIAYFDRSSVGRLTTRVTNDIEALNQLFSSGVVVFLADLLVLVGIAVALFIVNAELALITLCVLPPLLVATGIFRRAAQKHFREQRGHLAHLNGFSQESLQGMSVIQLFGREGAMAREYRSINDAYLAAFQRTVFCYSVYFPVVEVIGAAALVAILWRGGLGLREGTITFGDFYLFWTFLGKFLSPIRDMAERYNILQAAMAAAERVFKVLDTAPPAREIPAPTTTPPVRLRGEVEFRDVWFSYDPQAPDAVYAARGLNFKVSAGETVAIVGATGAGKSTVVNLLTRFHEPQKGSILVDGRDIAGSSAHELRRRIGLVLQDPFLFTRTVEENVSLGRSEVSRARMEDAARRVRASDVIARLPDGFETKLGERGGGLSSGEKQLLVFARALAGDPDILVLDEATAYVDPLTEGLIQSAVHELLRGRTAIVIAHRLSTIREAHRIVVLHKGEVREVGTHHELLARRGIYERLYRLQLAGGEDELASRALSGPEEPPEAPALPDDDESDEPKPDVS